MFDFVWFFVVWSCFDCVVGIGIVDEDVFLVVGCVYCFEVGVDVFVWVDVDFGKGLVVVCGDFLIEFFIDVEDVDFDVVWGE